MTGRRRLLALGLLAFAGLPSPAEATPCRTPRLSCEERKMIAFNPDVCLADCGNKRERLRLDSSVCPDLCEQARQQRERLVLLLCRDDEDGDGVQSPADRCPATLPFVAVNGQGCPDEDRDGIPEDEDRCPGTPAGARINPLGCEVDQVCEEGHCGEASPGCRTVAECDRLSETPLPFEVPREVLDATLLQALGRRAHPAPCPGDRTPPDQPRVTAPAEEITRIPIGEVSVELEDGQVKSGSVRTLEIAWEPVTDPCERVTYSVYLETYHCHELGGYVEPATYRNRGWCRWMPHLYRSVAVPALSVELPIGKLLYEVHRPFAAELGWDVHATGPFPISYMPFWIRLRVLAHDGNGTPSPFGLHNDSRYLVLYADDTVPLDLLTGIPVAP